METYVNPQKMILTSILNFKLLKVCFWFAFTASGFAIAEQQLTEADIIMHLLQTTPSIIIHILGAIWVSAKALSAGADFIHKIQMNKQELAKKKEEVKQEAIETKIKDKELLE